MFHFDLFSLLLGLNLNAILHLFNSVLYVSCSLHLDWIFSPCRENLPLPCGRLFRHILRQTICKYCVTYLLFKEQTLSNTFSEMKREASHDSAAISTLSNSYIFIKRTCWFFFLTDTLTLYLNFHGFTLKVLSKDYRHLHLQWNLKK